MKNAVAVFIMTVNPSTLRVMKGSSSSSCSNEGAPAAEAHDSLGAHKTEASRSFSFSC